MHLDRNFGLRDFNTIVPSDEEIDLDENLKMETIMSGQKKKLPWYLLSDDTMFAKG